MTEIDIEQRRGTAVLWLQRREEGPNLLGRGLLQALPGTLERLESDNTVEAVVIASRNRDGFMAGADISLFDELSDREETLALVRNAQQLIERIARLPKPTVAAVHGPCAGGGLELALACDYRVASSDDRTSFSLPEVQLGLLPALGGTQRLPPLVGLRTGLGMLLTGRKVYARAARRAGLVDAVIHSEGLEEAALQAAAQLRRGGGRRKPAVARLESLLTSTPAKELIFRRAEAEMQASTRGNYPAPLRILDVVRRSFGGDLQEGLRLEAEAFADLLLTEQSRALRHLFFVRSRARKNRFGHAASPIRRLAVLGAGLMGAGIAQVSAEPGGYEVVLRDQSFDLAAAGKAAVHRGLSKRVGKGMTAFSRDVAAQRVRIATDYQGLGRIDLTIEAVPEELELKRTVVREVESVTGPDHIFASNTSSLPIASIAEGAARPERVLGMHYFSPVPKMPLLEVVRGRQSSTAVLAAAVEVGLRQGKSVIVVGDSPGFYVNRILAPYLNEALLLLREGAAVEAVDRAMEQAGFPVGPFRLLDNVGLDVAAKVTDVLSPLFEQRGFTLDRSAAKLPAAGLNGRKSGRGFYQYPKQGKRTVNEEAYTLLDVGQRRKVPGPEIVERLLLALVNEAVHCLDEGIIESREDGDAGAVFGIGFPPFLGGPFKYVEVAGEEVVAARLRALEQRFGARFTPAAGLTPA